MSNFPSLQFFEFDTSEQDSPIGTRHIEGGSFAFKQRLSLGCQSYTVPGTSGTLMFENVISDTTQSHIESKVTAFIVRLGASGSVVSSMKLFLINDSALQASRDVGLDYGFVQIAPSGAWFPNPLLPSGAGQKLSNFPDQINIKRQDGQGSINGEQDLDVSQFIYTNLVLPNGHPLGEFGVCGSGFLRLGLVYDFFSIDDN